MGCDLSLASCYCACGGGGRAGCGVLGASLLRLMEDVCEVRGFAGGRFYRSLGRLCLGLGLGKIRLSWVVWV